MPMKILVCISAVPDTTSKISLSSNNFVNLDGLTLITGPYEDYALSRAIEIKEADPNNIEIVIFHVGPDSSEAIIRKCLALGADSAVRVNTKANDSLQVAQEIASFVKENSFDLILMGKESIDYNTGLVHQYTASILGWNHFSPVMNLDISTNSTCNLKVESSVGTVQLSSDLPLVLGCQEPIAEWKIPSMRGIMAARAKNIVLREPQFGFGLSYINDEVNDQQRKGQLFQRENLNELIEIIKKEVRA
jgi:electron transfer flavoprotein beta subunit